MWSDRLSEQRLNSLTGRLHSVLPAPSALTRGRETALQGNPTLEQVAELLHSEPGFALVNANPSDGAQTTYLLHGALATLSYANSSCEIVGPGGRIEISELGGFDSLEAALRAWRGGSGALLVGFLAYDLSAELEDLGEPPAGDLQFPQMQFGLYDAALRRDEDGWTLCSTDAWRNPLSPVAAEALLARAGSINIGTHFQQDPAEPITHEPLRSHPDADAFRRSVGQIVATIHAGDIFQTNLCRAIEATIEPRQEWQLFQRMRAINPARYEAFLRLDDHRSVFSISPEGFLKVTLGQDSTSIVESSPIKGTRPRAANMAEDQELAAGLQASEKDGAELAMIVDVVRNDLARVCEAGTVSVVDHAQLMSLPTVHHLVSTVRGALREGVSIVDLLRASFPPASISGAPKIEAMRVAQREEGQLRGPCMGAIGWISLDKPEQQQLEFSVAIRTAFATDGRVRYYAGCGITADSVAASELEESRHKARAFVRALGMEDDPHW